MPILDEVTTVTISSGITNGTTYVFKLRAVTSSAPGTSTSTVTVTAGVPAAPASLTAVAGDGQVVLTWTAPGSDNGGAVTGYSSQYKGSDDASFSAANDHGDVLTATITSLTNGTEYTFRVFAVNARGDGAAAEVEATPGSGSCTGCAPDAGGSGRRAGKSY